jgi:hypothetical protein
VKSIIILNFIVIILSIRITHAIECSSVSDPKVKNMIEDLSQITVDEKFLGSCAVNDDIAKQASWKDNIDQKVKNIKLEYERLDQLFTHLEVDGVTEEMLYKNKIPRDKIAEFNVFKKDPKKKQLEQEVKKGLKDKLIKMNDKLKTMAKQKNCVHDAEFVILPKEGFDRSHETITSKEEALKDIQKTIQKIETEGGTTICSQPVGNISQLEPVRNKVYLELGDDVFFADNSWTFDDTKSAKLKKMIDEKLKSNRPNCERKIRSVQIATSSSLLRNQITDPLGNEIPQASWDFYTLSKLRAKEIKDKIKETYGLEDNQIPKPNFLGENGNGTSGPCPYKLVKNPNGTYKVIRNSIDEKELKKHRYGKINIEFEEVGDGCLKVEDPKVIPNHFHYRSKCYSVILQCINPHR